MVELTIDGIKIRALEASGTLPVEPAQVILTQSEKVNKARRLIVELLLASCPNSKTSQDMAANMGINKVRFKIKDRGCILCGLCVRYCHEHCHRVSKSSQVFGSLR